MKPSRPDSAPPYRPSNLGDNNTIFLEQHQFRSTLTVSGSVGSSSSNNSPNVAESPLETETVFETPGVSPSPSMVSALEAPFCDTSTSTLLSDHSVGGAPLSAMSGSRVCNVRLVRA